MEFFLLVLLIVLLIVLINFKSETMGRIKGLEDSLYQLHRKLDKQALTATPPPMPKADVSAVASLATAAPPASQPPEPIAEEPVSSTAVEPIPAAEDPTYWKSNFVVVAEGSEQTDKPTHVEAPEEAIPAIAPPKPGAHLVKPGIPPRPSFFERNPDLEKFIGENLVSKIGIGILVLAIAFFVKYAIDNNWIGPVGRVAVGMVCGGILIGIAHRLRSTYKAFSSVLVGGGLAVFYFTITLAHQKFHLFGNTPTAAFIILLVITLFAVLLSLLYDRQELAVIALIGGFASPFMVSDGSGHYHTLFVYLIILNVGLLIIAYNKSWRVLNVLCFVFTNIIFGGWLATYNFTNSSQAIHALLYATVFYLLYFAITIANNIKENKRFIAIDFGMLLTNTALYFSAGLYCLFSMEADGYKGLFTALLGVFNLAVCYVMLRKKQIDTNILYLLIGITLTFVSLTAPLQLNGHYITLFWASEAVLLFWLYSKSRIPILRLTSFIIWCAMLISLLMDWDASYTNLSPTTIVFNKGFITGLYASVATGLLSILYQRAMGAGLKALAPLQWMMQIAVVLLYVTGALEVNFQFRQHFADVALHTIYLLLYTLCYVRLLLLAASRLPMFTLSVNITLLLMAGTLVCYFLWLPMTYQLQAQMLLEGKYGVHFTAHWASAVLILANVFKLIQLLRAGTNAARQVDGFAWILCAVLVAFFSVEVLLLVNTIFYQNNNLEALQRVYIKTGLPILWGICSFLFMWQGMKRKYKPLRIISLTLFSITLVKLFLFDISNIPIAGKIAAFFSLGVLLLVVSFMYQRLKKIITDDESKAE